MEQNRKVSEALKRLRMKIEKQGGTHILHTSQIRREDRELLLATRWLEEIIKGWYLVTRPDAPVGDSTPWYASFWDFLKLYLEARYKTDYCLSAEISLDLLVGDLTIPKQVIVIAKTGGGSLRLPYNTSLLVYADPLRLVGKKHAVEGLQVMPLAHALVRIAPIVFIKSPQKVEIALNSLEDISQILDVILRYNALSAAERLVGALRFIGRDKMASDLKSGLLSVGIKVAEVNPFEHEVPLIHTKEAKPPYALRIEAMWAAFREEVIQHFPKPSGKAKSPEACLKHIEELYNFDAYHSLSIEGYQVTNELIERVQNGLWSPDRNAQDAESRNALAARGYYEAFLKVRASITKILKGRQAARIASNDLPEWFRALFFPSVQAGILSPADLYGWRRHQVYTRGSRHTPLASDYLREAMEVFFKCLREEKHPAVRAILGHFLFVYIHPYMDGNGRIARFLMNTQFISGGYPWTIIRVENRLEYFAALEAASVDNDVVPFVRFVKSQMKKKLP